MFNHGHARHIVTLVLINYNLYVKKIITLIGLLSMMAHASRLKSNVAFTFVQSKINNYVPFTVIVPTSFSGQFVRFVHPFNGKSAVAKVVKREGNQYKTNPELAKAIGIQSSVGRVYIEEVY